MGYELKANHVFTHAHSGGVRAITFILDNGWLTTADQVTKDLSNKEIRLTVKQYRESKTIKQNRMIWSILTTVSEYYNGTADRQSKEELYAKMIVQAEIQYEINPIKLDNFEKHKETLSKSYRVINRTNVMYQLKDEVYVMCECYRGISQFDTKEAYRFIEVLLNYAYETIGFETQEQKELRKLLETMR